MLTTQREGRTEIIYYVIPLIATVSMAVVSDFRDWRIPNRLIAVGMIQGFLMSAVVRGPCDGLLSSVAGCVIPVVILFVLFHKKALGAGDIKPLLSPLGKYLNSITWSPFSRSSAINAPATVCISVFLPST